MRGIVAEREGGAASSRSPRLRWWKTILPCIQGCSAQRKYSVVPAGALTVTVIDRWRPDCWIAMLSSTVSRPGWPLSRVQWTIGLCSSGGAFGFFRCPVAYRWQAAQFSTWAPVLGRSVFPTIVSVCGSIDFVSANLNVSDSPLLTLTVPGEKYMLSLMYLFGANET